MLEIKISPKEIDELYCNENDSKNAIVRFSEYNDVIPVRNVFSNEKLVNVSLETKILIFPILLPV